MTTTSRTPLHDIRRIPVRVTPAPYALLCPGPVQSKATSWESGLRRAERPSVHDARMPHIDATPHEIAEDGHSDVLVLRHTTGSHLDLPDKDQRQLTVIWRASVSGGLLRSRQVLEDTPARRIELPATPPS
jgi:hypothetical protein